MSGRRKPDDHEPGGRITEAGHRPPPVDLVAIGPALHPRDLFAILREARAGPAALDVVLQLSKRGQSQLARHRLANHYTSMRGVRFTQPGGPEVIELADLADPRPSTDE